MKFSATAAAGLLAVYLSGCSDNSTTTVQPSMAPTTAVPMATTARAPTTSTGAFPTTLMNTTISVNTTTTVPATSSSTISVNTTTTMPATSSSATVTGTTVSTTGSASSFPATSTTNGTPPSSNTTIPSSSETASSVYTSVPVTSTTSGPTTASTTTSCLSIPRGEYCGKYLMFNGVATIGQDTFGLSVAPLVNLKNVGYALDDCTDFKPDYSNPAMVALAQKLGIPPQELASTLSISYKPSDDTFSVNVSGLGSLDLSKQQC